MNQFYTLQKNEYKAISFEKGYLCDHYQALNSFLKLHFESSTHNILGKPINSQESIKWYTNSKETFRQLDSNDTEHLKKYNAFLFEVQRKCSQLENEDDLDTRNWASLLKEVFSLDNNIVFTDGENLIIVWGYKFNLRKNYYIPLVDFEHLLQPNEPLEEEQTIKEGPIIDDTSLIEEDHTIEKAIPEVIELNEIEETAPIIQETPVATTETIPVKKHWFLRMLNWLENIFRKYWWLFLLLLLLIIFMFFRGCERKTTIIGDMNNDEKEEYLVRILPKQPRQITIPIDTANFIYDDDNHHKVLSNVVNLALTRDQDNFEDFAVDLKLKFPEDGYEIVYYDDQTSRLQFQFPKEERSTIKTKIKQELNTFKILAWDEAIFQSNRTLNDPALKNAAFNWHFKAINVEKAWDITLGDTSVVIAVIDDGFDLHHQELNKRILKPYNVLSKSSSITSGELQQHGTHVAGLALANGNNNFGSVGIAPNCSFMPIQIGDGSEYFSMTAIVDGILYAINHGADVVNLSLGKYYSPDLELASEVELEKYISQTGKDEETFWKELFLSADEKNVTIVIAGGNQNLPIGLDPMQRSKSVIKVISINNELNKSDFSNYMLSKYADKTYLGAPGSNIYSCIPANKHIAMDGTSMAAPIVTGSIALLKSIKPDLSNEEIINILWSTSITSEDGLTPIIQIDKALKMALTL